MTERAERSLGTGRLRRLVVNRVGDLPTAFWWLWFGTLVNRAGTFIAPFFVLYLTGPRHISIATAGAVLAVAGIGNVLSQPIGGVLTDRYGRRATLTASLTTTAAMLLALSVARPLAAIVPLAFALGVVSDMYRPASMAAVADLVDEQRRPRAYALQFWAINLGFAVASTSAGVLLHFGFGLLFVLDALTTLAFGLLALRFIPETRPHSDAPRARLGDPILLLRSDRLLLAASLIVLIYAILYVQVTVTLPLAITAVGLAPGVFGYVIAINGIVIVIGQPLTLNLLDRWPRRISLPIGIGLVGVGVAATGLCRTPWQFALTVVVWSVGEIATAGSFQAMIAALAPEHMRGRYAGAAGLAWGTAGMLGPLLGAGGYALSPGVLWLGCLTAGITAAIGQFWLVAAIERRRGPQRRGRVAEERVGT
jgi:MFS family permease